MNIPGIELNKKGNKMEQNLYLLCGIPGSGKSTWASKQNNAYIISRDAIRKSLVGEDVNNEKYFFKEKEVFSTFINEINLAIATCFYYHNKENIIVDATHISPASRKKVLSRLNLHHNLNLKIVAFPIDLKTALERNSKRTGFEKVPPEAIVRMYRNFILHDYDEFYYCLNKINTIDIQEVN